MRTGRSGSNNHAAGMDDQGRKQQRIKLDREKSIYLMGQVFLGVVSSP
jgi:hypothetical protein